MHVAVGFMPAFKYRQKNFLIVLERGHKAHGYVSAGEASKIPTGGPPMTTRLSVTGDLLIWTGLVTDRRYSAVVTTVRNYLGHHTSASSSSTRYSLILIAFEKPAIFFTSSRSRGMRPARSSSPIAMAKRVHVSLLSQLGDPGSVLEPAPSSSHNRSPAASIPMGETATS